VSANSAEGGAISFTGYVACLLTTRFELSAPDGQLYDGSNPPSPDAGEFRAYVDKLSEIVDESSEASGKSSEIRDKLSEAVS
jgi:hypothetical protein